MSLDQDGSRGARHTSHGVAVATAHAYRNTTFNRPVPTDGRRSWPSASAAGSPRQKARCRAAIVGTDVLTEVGRGLPGSTGPSQLVVVSCPGAATASRACTSPRRARADGLTDRPAAFEGKDRLDVRDDAAHCVVVVGQLAQQSTNVLPDLGVRFVVQVRPQLLEDAPLLRPRQAAAGEVAGDPE
jgi:hypothetical protein